MFGNQLLIFHCTSLGGGWDSVVDIVTHCGLDGLGIDSWWGVRSSVPIQTSPEAHPASCTMGTGSFPRLKQPGLGADLPPSSSTEVSNGIELYLCPPQCLHRHAMG